jgi:hypothetical protein
MPEPDRGLRIVTFRATEGILLHNQLGAITATCPAPGAARPVQGTLATEKMLSALRRARRHLLDERREQGEDERGGEGRQGDAAEEREQRALFEEAEHAPGEVVAD